jgi:hypothetical protein
MRLRGVVGLMRKIVACCQKMLLEALRKSRIEKALKLFLTFREIVDRKKFTNYTETSQDL